MESYARPFMLVETRGEAWIGDHVKTFHTHLKVRWVVCVRVGTFANTFSDTRRQADDCQVRYTYIYLSYLFISGKLER